MPGMHVTEITKEIASMWSFVPAKDKKEYQKRAEQEKIRVREER